MRYFFLTLVWLSAMFSAKAAPGAIDPTFLTKQIGGLGVMALAVQPDGKVIVGGRVDNAGGHPRAGLARLYPDGTVDVSFNPSPSLSFVSIIRLQPDGKILVADSATHPVVRLNPDGTVDPTFSMVPSGFVYAVEPLPDGKILVGGSLWTEDGSERRCLIRLNPDGSRDDSLPVDFNNDVVELARLDDGKIMVGGSFTAANGTDQNCLVRLNADCSPDPTYNASGATYVTQLVPQPDGKLLVGGWTNTGVAVLSRRSADGTLDPGFAASFSGASSNSISGLQLQADGKILVSGGFATVNGSPRARVARLLPNGALDATFQIPGTNNSALGCIVSQADGKILVGGDFSTLGGVDTPFLARLQNDPATSTFTKDATTLQWLRGGASPELGNVYFEKHDAASNQWLPLGNGTKIPGGWSIPSASLPPNGTIRARGHGRTAAASAIRASEAFAFGNAVPSIHIENSAGVELANNSPFHCGNILNGYNGVSELVVRNTGAGVLDAITISLTGADVSQFKIVESTPGQIEPGSSRSFGIQFSPLASGAKSAVLTISSNAPTGTITIPLTGNGTTDFSPYFGSADEIPLQTTAFVATGKTFGNLTLGFAPTPGTILTAIQQTSDDPLTGVFPDLPDGALVTATYGGQSYTFMAGYQGWRYVRNLRPALILTLRGPGTPLEDFAPQLGDGYTSIAVNQYGTMLLRGTGQLAMIRADGSPVTDFSPRLESGGNPGSVYYTAVCSDGKFLMAGTFDKAGGLPNRALCRIDADGKVDPTFQSSLAAEWIYGLAVQADGKILISSGNSGSTVRRLNADGSLDPSFSITVTGFAGPIYPLRNGQILIGGGITAINNIPKTILARVNSDGSLDESFVFFTDDTFDRVGSIAEQADGKLLIEDGAQAAGTILRRLLPDGALDTTFTPVFQETPRFPVVGTQSDGKILVGGTFMEVNGRPRTGMVRFLPDSTVDSTFTCNSNVSYMAQSRDGGLIINGAVLNGAAQTGLVRLLNDPGQMTPEVPDSSTVRLTTSGSAPALRAVSFHLLAAGATGWTALPAPTVSAGTWSLTGQSLPPAGIIRWRAVPMGTSHSSTMIEGYLNFGTAAPSILVKTPAGSNMPSSGGAIDFGPTLNGQSRTLKLSVTNLGNGAWDDFGTVFSGADAASFTLTTAPSRAILPGETGVFEIRFAPVGTGPHTALLTLSGNDPVRNPFPITLTGTSGTVFSPTFHAPGDIPLSVGSFIASGKTFGVLSLAFAPQPGTKLVAIQSTGSVVISGTFSDLPNGSIVSASFGGITYQFLAGYVGGDGNELTLSLIGPGVQDTAFLSSVELGAVSVTVPLESGESIIGGAFTSVSGTTRNYMARLKPDGTLDTTYNPNPNGSVEAIHRFANGEMLVAGNFTTFGIEQTGRIVKLKADGSINPMFMANPDAVVRALAVQADGKIVIAGDFVKVNGATRNRIARLNPDGSLDTTFNPNAGGPVTALTLQRDGMILIGGSFRTLGGVSKYYLARLLPSGTPDPSFTATLTYSVSITQGLINAIHLQADDKILIGGRFNQLNGATSTNLARLLPTGETDTSFIGTANGIVSAIVSQVDGKLLVGGEFTAINGVGRSRFARLHPDGSLDSTITTAIGGNVAQIALRPDGQILVGGNLVRVNGVSKSHFAKLLNDSVSSSSQVAGPSTFRWIRGGALPQESGVVFEIHEAGESGWKPMGIPGRVTGGWELNGFPLPPSGIVRARTTIPSGESTYPQTHLLTPFGNAVPALTVLDRAGRRLQHAISQADFGAIPLTLSSDMEIQLANDGLADLQSIAASISGAAAADFSITSSPSATLPATGVSKIVIRFTPSLAGLRQAELRITSNDPTASPFVIALVGKGGSEFSPTFASINDKPLSGSSISLAGMSFGTLNLEFLPPEGSSLVAISKTGSGAITGTLAGLPDKSRITANFGGQSYSFLTSYRGGDGNDLVFIRTGPGVANPAFDPTPNLAVHALGSQPDGKIIISGDFTTLGGVAKSRIARLHQNGSLDTTFDHQLSASATGITVQRDGKIIVCAPTLTAPGGTIRTGLARLNQDGTLDSGFAPQVTGTVSRALELKSGKILIGGTFTQVGATSKSSIALLNEDGTLDTSFTATASGGGTTVIQDFAELPDTSILIAGSFLSVNSTTRNYLAKLNSTGGLDTTFVSTVVAPVNSFATGMSCLAVQPDGKIIVGGHIGSVNGTPRNRLVRLNPDGTLDDGFLAALDNIPSTILPQVDGRILISGTFAKVNGESRPGIARLNSDGGVDASFNPGPVYSGSRQNTMVMQADGTLLVGGNFTSINGIGSGYLARLSASPASSLLAMTGATTAGWTRSGAMPELQDIVAEISQDNGATWVVTGTAARSQTGWTISNLTLPSQGFIRVTGREVLSTRSSGIIREFASFGRSLTAIEEWRKQQFGTPVPGAITADMGDPDADGYSNLLEYAFGSDPWQNSRIPLPAWTWENGQYVIEIEKPAGVGGVTYGAEWSATMTPGDWHPAEALTTGDTRSFRVPSAGQEKLFFRLKVTNP